MMYHAKPYYCSLILCCYFILPNTILGQGAIIDTAFYNSLPGQSTYGDGAKSEAEALAGIFKVDLKPYCPEVGFQGYVQSTCTGWAVGYAAQSMLYAINNNLEGETEKITEHAFSVLFLYNQLKNIKIKSCGVGTYIGKALEILKTEGNVLAKEFDKENDCNRLPKEPELNFAKNYKIENFITLFKAGETAKIIIHKIKLSIAQKKPVIISIPITKKFQKLKKPIWKPAKNSQPAGHHAMVVVGFDEDKKAFEIMNSWGKGWANGGFCWIGYDDLANTVVEAFQMEMYNSSEDVEVLDSIASNKTTYLSAHFSFNKLVEYDGFTAFQNIDLFYKEDKDIYEIESVFHINDIAQFNISEVSERTYVYMFSYNENSGINVHWPRDEVFDNKFTGLNESALITVPEVELVLPTPDTAFQFDTAGEDFLCFLFSKSPINNFNDMLALLEADHKMSFKESIEAILSGKSNEFESMMCRSGKVAELSGYVKNNHIVPVIFKIIVEEN